METLSLVIPVRDRRLNPSSAQKEAIARYLGQGKKLAVSVKFSGPKKVRSLKANAYLWGCVYMLISEHTGMTCEDIHDWCREEFLPRRFVMLGGKEKEIRKSTSELEPREFNAYLERVIAKASELGVMIPMSDGGIRA